MSSAQTALPFNGSLTLQHNTASLPTLGVAGWCFIGSFISDKLDLWSISQCLSIPYQNAKEHFKQIINKAKKGLHIKLLENQRRFKLISNNPWCEGAESSNPSNNNRSEKPLRLNFFWIQVTSKQNLVLYAMADRCSWSRQPSRESTRAVSRIVNTTQEDEEEVMTDEEYNGAYI